MNSTAFHLRERSPVESEPSPEPSTIGTLKNDTVALIEDGADVRAKNDVAVHALGIKDIDGYSFSGAGGAIALAASISVWSVGTQIERGLLGQERERFELDGW